MRGHATGRRSDANTDPKLACMTVPDEVAIALQSAFLAAYRPCIDAALARHAIESDIGEAVSAGEAWLADSLGALLRRPFVDQLRGPLELFQEAMRIPTEALVAAGATPPPRDPVAISALPGDLFSLAPSSSQELGDEAWGSHLAWGAAKAAALRRPRVGLLSRDLMDRSRIEPVVSAAGMRLTAVDVRELDNPPQVVLVDLTHPDADEVIELGAAAGSRVVAYGPHVDDLALVRARSLGARDAVARSRFFRSIASFLPTLG